LSAGGLPLSITSGTDGKLWFTVLAPPCDFGICPVPVGAAIGSISTNGAITLFPLPDGSAASSGAQDLVSGSDGNLWFTQSDRIASISPAGVIHEYSIPTANSIAAGIASGAEGNIWFAESGANKIGKLSLPTGRITITSGYTGNWYNPSQSGHGFSVEVLANASMLVEWFVFAPDGGPTWIIATGPITGNTATLQAYQTAGPGGRFPPNFDPSQVHNLSWGALTLAFTDCNNGTASWEPTVTGYSAGSIPITRLTLPARLKCP